MRAEKKGEKRPETEVGVISSSSRIRGKKDLFFFSLFYLFELFVLRGQRGVFRGELGVLRRQGGVALLHRLFGGVVVVVVREGKKREKRERERVESFFECRLD